MMGSAMPPWMTTTSIEKLSTKDSPHCLRMYGPSLSRKELIEGGRRLKRKSKGGGKKMDMALMTGNTSYKFKKSLESARAGSF